MFEQSILVHHGGARKTSTLFASFAAQIVICGVLVVLPLIYTNVLPAFRLPDHLPPVYVPQRPAPEIVATETATNQSMDRPVFRPQVLTAPARVPRSLTPVIDGAPPAITGVGDSFPNPVSSVPGVEAIPEIAAPKPVPVVEQPAPVAKPVPVSSGVLAAKLIKRVIPVYPDLAKRTRVSGKVRLLGIIAKDGTVKDLKVLEGHPWLAKAARDAVLQWVYTPTILSGQPVEVEAPIDVIFELK